MNGKDITKLAADLGAGYITQEYIRATYGSSVLTAVLGVAGGVAAGVASNYLLDMLDKETGIVSDIGSLVDDVFSVFD